MELDHVQKQEGEKTWLMGFGTNARCFSKERGLSSPLSCTQGPWPAALASASWLKTSCHSMKTFCCGVPQSSDWPVTSSQMLGTGSKNCQRWSWEESAHYFYNGLGFQRACQGHKPSEPPPVRKTAQATSTHCHLLTKTYSVGFGVTRPSLDS